MIKKLKIRFIVLAMVSLTVLLSLIVAGMNIANYRNVVNNADQRIEVLEENASRLFGGRDGGASGIPGGFFSGPNGRGSGTGSFDDFDADGPFFGRGGSGGPSMSRDEAEESRFFTVELDSSGDILRTNVDRIYSVDSSGAKAMAEEVLASGEDKGFVDDFRYSVNEGSETTDITFLDCGRTLDSFRDFLKASVLMSLLGLLLVFFVILYFAGRIVRPVAESYEKQKRFITDAGHEIKTPLAIIKANLDLMEMELDGAEGSAPGDMAKAAGELRESLSDINDQVGRLTGLTNDLVYLSRMEEGGSTMVMTEVPLSDIVSETVASFETLAKENGKSIAADITPMITAKGSHKELEKLVSILMENAVKYSAGADGDAGSSSAGLGSDGSGSSNDDIGGAGAPPIEVSLRKDGRNAVFEVRNMTEGELTNESLSHVFERFYRTDSSRNSEAGGHGIGLSMASAIVSAHGGKISARTSSGRDFIITAAIPAV